MAAGAMIRQSSYTAMTRVFYYGTTWAESIKVESRVAREHWCN